ncbi:MAG: hypothetical protein ACI9G5_000118 [Paracoccaceae bacterium]|jgi:hypothetical protein
MGALKRRARLVVSGLGMCLLGGCGSADQPLYDNRALGLGLQLSVMRPESKLVAPV